MRWLYVLLALQLVCVSATAEEPPVQAPDFKAGQHWSYHTRPQEPESTLVVGRVEELPSIGTVVHISVIDVAISGRRPGQFTHVVHHMPISPAALRKSVVSYLGDASVAEYFEDGYNTWRKSNGGVFTITVREAVEFIQQSISKSD